MLNMNMSSEDGCLTVTLAGALDTITSVDVDRKIGDVSGYRAVILDMEGVDYITSAGVRVLLGVKRRMSPGSELSLRNLQPLVRHIFETCGLKGLIGK